MTNKSSTDLDSTKYKYTGEMRACHMHGLLLPEIEKRLDPALKHSIFDLGCGNGSTADFFLKMGHTVVGVDPSEDGIAIAKRSLEFTRG